VLLLVILLFSLQVHNLYGGSPVTSPTRKEVSEVARKLKFPFSYYSLSVTPEGNLSLPLEFDFRKYVKGEIKEYSTRVSEAILNLEDLKKKAEEKNFVVPLRFIEANLRAARDLYELFKGNIEEIDELLKGPLHHREIDLIKEKLRNIRLLSERIGVMWKSSSDFYRKTTNFVPFRVELVE